MDEYTELEDQAVREEKIIIFSELWRWVEKDINRVNIVKGWAKKYRSDGELIALIHSEISECCEAMRLNNPLSEKESLAKHEITCAEEELADALIRIMDLAFSRGYNIPKALFFKMEYNKTRPYRHGGKLF